MGRAARMEAKAAAAKAMAKEIAEETLNLSNAEAFHAVRKLWVDRWQHTRSWKIGMQAIWDYRRYLLEQRRIAETKEQQ